MNMGNFEKLSVLVIVVIIVMILVVALYTWTGDPSGTETAAANVTSEKVIEGPQSGVKFPKTPAEGPKIGGPIAGPVGGGMDDVGRKNLTADELIAQMKRDAAARAAQSGVGSGGAGMSDGIDPAPPVPPETPVVKEPRYHVVAAGETIGKIAKIEYPGVGQRAIDGILKANPTVDPTRMAINAKLLMPDLGNIQVADTKVTDGGKKAGGGGSESVAASIRPGTLYVTKKGDTLPNLAKRAYHDGNQWHRIWVENFDDITDTEHLQPGMRLRIPVLN